MKTTKIFFGFLVVLFLTSCVENKYVFRGNYLYEVMEDGSGNGQVKRHTTSKGFKARITEKDGYLTVERENNEKYNHLCAPDSTTTDGGEISGGVLWEGATTKTLLFFNNKYTQIIADKTTSYNRKTFTYFGTGFSLGALTIPIKVRPKLNDPALLDSFPAQAEAGINIGLSAGWRFSFHIFSTRKNIFGSYNNTISLTPGIFLGAGVTELSAANTRPVVQFNRKAVMLSPGGYFMIGFNFLNLGYAFGFDFATGKYSGDWLYKGKMWHGIIFAITIK